VANVCSCARCGRRNLHGASQSRKCGRLTRACCRSPSIARRRPDLGAKRERGAVQAPLELFLKLP
jgi:hypothetical protein